MDPWVMLHEEPLKTGYRKILHRTFRMPNGAVEEYDIKLEPQVVCILPLTSEQQVILARQFRVGPNQILLELPGGGIDPGETPQQAAERELLEETGYGGILHYVCLSLDDGYSTLVRHNFIATDCQKLQEPQSDNGEFTEVVKMSLADFRQHLRGGQLSDIETGYLGLDYLGLL